MDDERRRKESRDEEPGLVVGPTAGGPDVELEPPSSAVHGGVRADADIADDVRRRLGMHGTLDARGVEVRVRNGEVTLQGRVEDEPARHVAGLIADAVPGVRTVVNRLEMARG